MIWHYLKLTFRKLGKSYIFSVINIGGLTIALASSFLIFLFVLNELSTDRFHKNKDEIYRVICWFDRGDLDRWAFASSPFIMAEVIKDIYPEIQDITRVCEYGRFYGGQYVFKDEDYIREPEFIIVDQSFFDIFSFDILSGDRNNLITDINSLVLSEHAAQKYFPDENPIGRMLRIKNYEDEREFVITGVFRNMPSNSSYKADFIGNVELASSFYRPRDWNISNTKTFIRFDKNTDPDEFVQKLADFGEQYHPDNSQTYALQNLKDIYFKSGFIRWNYQPAGSYKLIIMLAIIGFLILLIACINYLIISTAKSSERAIEIGMRKVLGADKSTLRWQIMIESILVALISFPVAIMLSELSLPLLINLLGKEIDLNYLSNWPYLAGIFMITLLVGLLSGSYISVFVASFNPEQIFKKQFGKKTSKLDFRKILISTQIVIFVILFIFSSVIIRQIDFVKHKEVGYNSEDLVIIFPPHDHDMYNCRTFVDEIQKNPNVINASEVAAGLFSGVSMFHEMETESDPENKHEYSILRADPQYLETMKFKLIEGRGFEKGLSSDTASIIINTTASRLHFGDDSPCGKILKTGNGTRFTVVGVVNDFHFQSLHSKIPPMGLMLKEERQMINQVVVKINPINAQGTIAFLEDSWNQYGPYGRFDYEYFNSKIDEQYDQDQNFSNTIKIFTLLTLAIGMLGMFGFSFYNARQKIKQIGIRKVFGATPDIILMMIIKELLILIIIANLIAWPISWFISSRWLEDFAYCTTIPIWIFVLGLISSLFIVIITSGIIAWRAAHLNPADSLRYE